MTLAELQYKMCPNNIQCTKGHPCPFHIGAACTISAGYNRQLSQQHPNNSMDYKRDWSPADRILRA